MTLECLHRFMSLLSADNISIRAYPRFVPSHFYLTSAAQSLNYLSPYSPMHIDKKASKNPQELMDTTSSFHQEPGAAGQCGSELPRMATYTISFLFVLPCSRNEQFFPDFRNTPGRIRTDPFPNPSPLGTQIGARAELSLLRRGGNATSFNLPCLSGPSKKSYPYRKLLSLVDSLI